MKLTVPRLVALALASTIIVLLAAAVGGPQLGFQPSAAAASARPTPTPQGAEAQAMQRTRPGPAPTPVPLYRTATAADVAANVMNDEFVLHILKGAKHAGPNFNPRVAEGILGLPVFARGLKPGSPGNWLVPVNYQGKPIAVFSIGQDQAGMGAAALYSGWPYDTIPAVPEADARIIGSAPGDPAVKVELVWARLLDRRSGGTNPFWHVVRASGAEFYIFEDRQLTPPSAVTQL